MAFPFKSNLFSTPRDLALEKCATRNSGHVSTQDNRVGPHVRKIQEALLTIAAQDPKLQGKVTIFAGDISTQTYGESTARAVLAYKQDRKIINFSYQKSADAIVGIMTISQLDDEIFAIEQRRPVPPPQPPAPTHDQIIKKAFDSSRAAVGFALSQLRQLEDAINFIDTLSGNDKIIAIQNLGRVHARNIAVVQKRLFVGDPLSTEFRAALHQAIKLVDQNGSETSNIIDSGKIGRCDPSLPNNNGGVPFGATTRTDPDPRVSVCTPFFASNVDLQRDVITHEFFHLVGLADIKGTDNTVKALNNANTLAQIVAWITDRSRQVNSDGNEAAVPPLPSP
jgi:hypothetical protein